MSSKLSRRHFLQASAAAGAALSVAQGAHAAGSDQIRFGIIGCGGRGMGASRNALDAVPNTKLVAMGELFEDRALVARDAVSEAF
ncbi:MAG: twin-arginine translocation signal domain-containing protein, partial [Thermoguttaceae bacterium]|nr:twin-arginine translocation signal domain-containing protein [Thermoguttaceae bacterium]